MCDKANCSDEECDPLRFLNKAFKKYVKVDEGKEEKGKVVVGKVGKKREVKKCEHGMKKSECKECGGVSICEHNKRRDRCKDCGGSQICEHRKIKSICRECKGSQICEHLKIRSKCKDCAGYLICDHNKYKLFCKDCKGNAICEHGNIKYRCKDCGGSQICIHRRYKSTCKECCGSSVCKHGKQKSQCKDCGGASFCEHKRLKYRCKECGGTSVCEHNRWRSICKDCKGSLICDHGMIKYTCVVCKGASICEHGKRKTQCKDCGGSQLCKTNMCERIAQNKKYQGYCYRCFINIFPDSELVRNHKTKERAVADYIREQFPQYTILLDRRVPDGCSLRKPDILIDFGEYVLIIEIDENQHQSYDCSCENKRLMILFEDIGSRPMVMIRFNPDRYYDHKGQSIPSCWGYTEEKGLCHIKPNKKREWLQRLESLRDTIQLMIEYKGIRKEIDVVHLFYDENLK